MELWMVIPLLMVGWIGWVVLQGVRRGRSYKAKAEELGLRYSGADDALADQLNDQLPMFSKGRSSCWSVVQGVCSHGSLSIFQYSFVHKNNPGKRSDRENVGLVFYLKGKEIDSRLDADAVAQLSKEWQIESNDRCMALKKRQDRGKEGLSGEQLAQFYDDSLAVLNRVLQPA